jgi:Transposase DDE domain
VDDRKPILHLAQRLFGKLVGDKSYLSQRLAHELLQRLGVPLVTKLKKNTQNRLMLLSDR